MTRDELLAKPFGWDAEGCKQLTLGEVLDLEGLVLVPIAYPNLMANDLVGVPREFIKSRKGPIDKQIREAERHHCAELVRAEKSATASPSWNDALEEAARAIEKGEHGES